MNGMSGNRSLIQATGFTLLEVLVALAIIAIALAATLRASAQAVVTASTLHGRYLADLVAGNRVALLRATRQRLHPGTSEGEIRMADLDFRWRQVVSTTPTPHFCRVEITVHPAQDEARGRVLSRVVIYPLQP